jgi:long-chain acyl-CoA synthetase
MSKQVYDIVKDAARLWPNNVAIFDEYGQMTFAELYSSCEFLRLWLLENGVEKGMGLGLLSRNSRFFVVALFAAAGTGAVVLPLSHQMKKAEIDEVVREAGLHFVLDDYSGVDPLESSPKVYENLTHLPGFRLQQSNNPFENPLAPHLPDAVFIRFSSGTTGKSKGVVMGNQSVYERVDAANELLKLTPNDVVLWVLPMAFHFVVSIVLYVRVGAAIAISRDFLAETMLDYSRRFKATLLYASPMHIRLLSSYAGNERLDSLRMVISTSTAISAADIKSFTEKYQKPISQAYGIIEIGLPIINHLNPEQNPEAVGYALPAYQVEILDDDNNLLPPGEIGHLAISGPGMFDGYLSPPTLRQEILNGSWFMTGDLATKDLDGLITVRGRKKSMINVSGNKVFPEEVEHVLNTHPDVKESRVFGGKHILLGEVVQAEVVAANGREDTESLIRFCREKLSTYKIPQRISFVNELQRTETGKLKR